MTTAKTVLSVVFCAQYMIHRGAAREIASDPSYLQTGWVTINSAVVQNWRKL
jgi:hypothetical protein